MSHGPTSKRRSSEDDDFQGPAPPDGGWGWVVVFASFMIHIVTDGVTYSFGVFYLEFINYFESKKAETAWIASLLVGVTLCSGPISSSFVNRYGCRMVTIAGAVLASICLMISVFATNVIMLYFTIGVGTGFGFGLIYLPAIVSVTVYFEKYRSLATGIAVCGSGLGTFIFAPFSEYLVDSFGWRGAVLIISALVLNCIIFGALFRPLEEDQSKELPKENGLLLKNAKAETDLAITNNTVSTFVEIPISNNAITNGDTSMKRPHSIGYLSTPKVAVRAIASSDHQNGNVPNRKLKSSDATRLALSQPLLLTSGTSSEPGTHFGSQSLRSRGPLHRRDIFYQGSLMNIPQYRSRNDLKTEETQLMERRASLSGHHYTSSHGNESDDEVEEALCGQCDPETRETLAEMLDFSLFKDPIFILFTLSNFCTSIGFNVPYVYIVAQADSRGISVKDSSYLLAIIGIANTVGRIVLGYLSDKPWINRLLVYNTCLTICGIATFFSAFCFDFYSFAVYAIVFGFTIGAYVGLTSVILVDLLGLDKLTNAFGLLLLFQGIASLVGPPIAGALYDMLESYNPGFYVAGIMIAASGVMLYVIPVMQRWLDQRRLAMGTRNSTPRDEALTQTI